MVYLDPYNKVIFEWQTSDSSGSKTLHSVSLEIPFQNISIRFTKNSQETLTTLGYVFNHSVDKLPVISLKGQAYKSPFDNGGVGFSGIEYLYSAYVSSGKNASSPSLKKTIGSSLNQSVLPSAQNVSRKISSTLTGAAASVFAKSTVVSNIKDIAVSLGVVSASGTITPNPTNPISYTGTVVNNIRNSLSSYSQTLSSNTASAVSGVVGGINTGNVDAVITELGNLSAVSSEVLSVYQRGLYIKDSFLNSKSRYNYSPRLDPTILRTLSRDQDILQKSIASQRIFSKYRQIQNTQNLVRDQIRKLEKEDYVIIVTMYWQDMVFRGHFNSFNLSQSKDFPNLWDWDCMLTSQESWLLKNNAIVAMDKTFDTNITTNTPIVKASQP